MEKKKKISISGNLFLIAGLILLILKLTAYPDISWPCILLVASFPWFLIGVVIFICLFVGLCIEVAKHILGGRK